MNTPKKFLSLAAWILSLSPLVAQEVSYSLTSQEIALNLTIRAAAPGTFETDEDGKFVIVDGKKVRAFESDVETLNSNGDVTKEVSTFSAKQIKDRRYDNAALLRDLFGTAVAGWKLRVISEGEGYSLIARKSGSEDVEIGTINFEPVVSFGTMTETTTYDANGDPTVKTAGSLRSESLVSLDLSAGSSSLNLTGNLRETVKAFSWYPDPTDKSTEEVIYPSAGAVLERLVGSFQRGEANAAFIFGGARIGPSSEKKD